MESGGLGMIVFLLIAVLEITSDHRHPRESHTSSDPAVGSPGY